MKRRLSDFRDAQKVDIETDVPEGDASRWLPDGVMRDGVITLVALFGFALALLALAHG